MTSLKKLSHANSCQKPYALCKQGAIPRGNHQPRATGGSSKPVDFLRASTCLSVVRGCRYSSGCRCSRAAAARDDAAALASRRSRVIFFTSVPSGDPRLDNIFLKVQHWSATRRCSIRMRWPLDSGPAPLSTPQPGRQDLPGRKTRPRVHSHRQHRHSRRTFTG